MTARYPYQFVHFVEHWHSYCQWLNTFSISPNTIPRKDKLAPRQSPQKVDNMLRLKVFLAPTLHDALISCQEISPRPLLPAELRRPRAIAALPEALRGLHLTIWIPPGRFRFVWALLGRHLHKQRSRIDGLQALYLLQFIRARATRERPGCRLSRSRQTDWLAVTTSSVFELAQTPCLPRKNLRR